MEPKAAQLAATASAALSAPFTTACRVVCASHLSIVSQSFSPVYPLLCKKCVWCSVRSAKSKVGLLQSVHADVRQQWLSSRAQMQKLMPLLGSSLMRLVQLQHAERLESERRLADKYDRASDEAARLVAELQRKGREALEQALAEAERQKDAEL